MKRLGIKYFFSILCEEDTLGRHCYHQRIILVSGSYTSQVKPPLHWWCLVIVIDYSGISQHIRALETVLVIFNSEVMH